MGLLPRRRRLPPQLRVALDRGEEALAVVATVDGPTLAVTRFGLWLVQGDGAQRWPWPMISKAALAGGVLAVTVADEVERWPDGISVLRDRTPTALRPTTSSRLTDIVHQRVRRSVAASTQVAVGDHSGWVVLRRTPGRDGLAAQFRPDAGADPAAPGVAEAVRATIERMRRGTGGALLDED